MVSKLQLTKLGLTDRSRQGLIGIDRDLLRLLFSFSFFFLFSLPQGLLWIVTWPSSSTQRLTLHTFVKGKKKKERKDSVSVLFFANNVPVACA